MNAIAPAVEAPRPTLKTWLMAARPKTLTAALVPVMVGTALAYGLGVGRWLPALAALVGAMFIQIGTNLTNDYYDFKKGADTEERLGPQRVTQSGLIAPGTVLASALTFFGLAVATGIYLVVVGGWPIVAIGLASVLAGYAYTGGPFPLAYHGLGDVFVFIFFGLVAVPGTFYVQALTVGPAAWWAAIPVGAIGTALLVVNNLRDASHGREGGQADVDRAPGHDGGEGRVRAAAGRGLRDAAGDVGPGAGEPVGAAGAAERAGGGAAVEAGARGAGSGAEPGAGRHGEAATGVRAALLGGAVPEVR